MSYFWADQTYMENTSNSFVQLAKVLRQYSSTVNSINSNLSLSFAERESIRRYLSRVSGQILSEAAGMNTLSGALRTIAAEYQKTEKLLISSGAATAPLPKTYADQKSDGSEKGFWEKLKEKAAKIREEIRYWLVDHEIIRATKQERQEGQPVTKRQEREMNLYMRYEAQKILKEERFSEKTWRNASVEERKKILQEYMDRIYGILGLPRVSVEWSDTQAENGYVTMGYYSPNDNSVHINEWVMREGDANHFNSYDLLPTIAHEMRHYYQREAIRHPEKYVVTEETIQSWQDSFENYRGQEEFMRDFGMTEQEAFEAYRNQTVEVDARWFEGKE